MRSLIISLPKSSPLLFPIHPVIHKQQTTRQVFSYIRSLFIGIDVPLPPLKQAIITTHKNQHKLHLSYTHSDRHFLQRTQQLCTKVGLSCDTLQFNPSTSTSTSSQKHIIDLELLPDEWDDEFLQPQSIQIQTSSQPSLSASPPPKPKNKKHPKKHVKFSPLTGSPLPPPSHVHYYTGPTMTFSEWEKRPYEHNNLPYTFCIQCEKPLKHKYWYNHIITHTHKKQTTTTPTTTTTTTTTTTPTPKQRQPKPTTSSTNQKSSKATYECPYDGCNHKFNPNTSHFIRDLNEHIDYYHDETYTYTY